MTKGKGGRRPLTSSFPFLAPDWPRTEVDAGRWQPRGVLWTNQDARKDTEAKNARKRTRRREKKFKEERKKRKQKKVERRKKKIKSGEGKESRPGAGWTGRERAGVEDSKQALLPSRPKCAF